MNGRVIVCTIGFLSGENLRDLHDSIAYSPTTDLCISMNSIKNEPLLQARYLAKEYPESVFLIENGRNAGCSYAWNEMIHRYIDVYDAVIIANDDIEFGFEDPDRIRQAVFDNPEAFIISCGGTHVGQNRPEPSHGFSCFGITRHAIETVGYFDENIKPAYCEDVDWKLRAVRLGLHEAYAPGCQVRHFGSWSINNDPTVRLMNNHTHHQNFAYYQQKWGGMIGRETFDYPFNNPSISLRIPYEKARDPYIEWGYSRREE